MVPRVAMFTTAGETRLIMGASVGIGVSPTARRQCGVACNRERGQRVDKGDSKDFLLEWTCG